MAVLGELAGAVGPWEGTSGFRLMPTDELAVAPATASVATGAGGHVATVGYTWSHPDDGAQQGLLVVGHTEDGHQAVAFWSDSWHQPWARILTALPADRGLSFECEYATGWFWRVTVAVTSDEFALRMLNVVPRSEEHDGTADGAYEVMVMDLRRVS